MDVVRVVLVDDHRLLTESLAAHLSRVPDILVVGTYTPGDPGLLAAVRRSRPDVVVVETMSVRIRSRRILNRVRIAWPEARLISLTADQDLDGAVLAARSGVDAWVSKESGLEDLLEAIREVCRGHACYPPAQLGAVLRALREDVRRAREQDGPLDSLTARERDVLHGMVEGCSAGEIADALDVSAHTIRTHMNKVFSKIGVHSRLEAVSFARSVGFYPDEAFGAGAQARTPRPGRILSAIGGRSFSEGPRRVIPGARPATVRTRRQPS
ncbi:LuxR C-terminal-related transcriptional regulator [Pseudonocardia hispaniensis]|uniref:LuxR C-terminal-related transcriptional regulator n=1 Tax=Pseudonocardia hispaniensis TaxID=904933 RepID=A0ABW1J2Z1_9PSEU